MMCDFCREKALNFRKGLLLMEYELDERGLPIPGTGRQFPLSASARDIGQFSVGMGVYLTSLQLFSLLALSLAFFVGIPLMVMNGLGSEFTSTYVVEAGGEVQVCCYYHKWSQLILVTSMDKKHYFDHMLLNCLYIRISRLVQECTLGSLYTHIQFIAGLKSMLIDICLLFSFKECVKPWPSSTLFLKLTLGSWCPHNGFSSQYACPAECSVTQSDIAPTCSNITFGKTEESGENAFSGHFTVNL